MSPEIIALIILGAIALLLASLVVTRPRLRRQRLRMRFGPEYDHLVRNRENREEAERELLARERRHKKLDLRPLDPTTRERYRAEWAAVQKQFVDSPIGAVEGADRLITSIMTDQGYPTEGHGQRLADLSVAHPHAIEHWRLAYDTSSGTGGTTSDTDAATEELRQALVHYRVVFGELLSEDGGHRDTSHGSDLGERVRGRAQRHTRRHA